jgi:hypothetical protein
MADTCPNCCLPATGPGLAFADGTICNEPAHAGSIAATRWRCELCGASAVVTYPTDASIYEVLGEINRSHAEHTPSCVMTDLSRIRVSPADPLAAARAHPPIQEMDDA